MKQRLWLRLRALAAAILIFTSMTGLVQEDGCYDPSADIDGDQYAPDQGDCNDLELLVHPVRGELCNGVDDDCNGLIDEDPYTGAYLRDADGDGFGTSSDTLCVPTSGYVAVRGDCDDDDPSARPGSAFEVPADGIDTDCGGTDGIDPHLGFGASTMDLLQEAINAAASDVPVTIWLGDVGDVWEVDLTFSNKTITISSVYTERITINAARDGRPFTLTGTDADLTLDGLVLKNGDAYHGGAIYMTANNFLIIKNCLFEQNSAFDYGGGISSFGSPVTIIGSTFSANSAYRGGAVMVYQAPIVITNSSFYKNVATYSAGAAYIYESYADVRYSNFDDNVADASAGGISIAYGDLYVGQSNFRNNVVGYAGGGISMASATGEVRNSMFSGNTGYMGSGLYVADSSPELSNLIITYNTATSGGGGGLVFEGSSESSAEYLTIAGNTGGGVALRYDAQPYIINSVVAFNGGTDMQFTAPGPEAVGRITFNDVFDVEGKISDLTLDASNLSVDPLFEGDADMHLSLSSPLLTASSEYLGDAFMQIGGYGGYGMLDWDADHDNSRRYWWAGTVSDVPENDAADLESGYYDCNDSDASVQFCAQKAPHYYPAGTRHSSRHSRQPSTRQLRDVALQAAASN